MIDGFTISDIYCSLITTNIMNKKDKKDIECQCKYKKDNCWLDNISERVGPIFIKILFILMIVVGLYFGLPLLFAMMGKIIFICYSLIMSFFNLIKYYYSLMSFNLF